MTDAVRDVLVIRGRHLFVLMAVFMSPVFLV